jgi:hypothetical protein
MEGVKNVLAKKYRLDEFDGEYEVREGDEWSFFCWPGEEEKLLKEGVDPDALPDVNNELKPKDRGGGMRRARLPQG